MVLEKTAESPLDNPKGNQPWILIGRNDAEAETPIIWSLGGESWLIGNNPDGRKDWGQEEKGATEDEMVEWHHNSMDMSLNKFWETVKDREALYAAVYGAAKSQTQ